MEEGFWPGPSLKKFGLMYHFWAGPMRWSKTEYDHFWERATTFSPGSVGN
jgi:hypothetical protein